MWRVDVLRGRHPSTHLPLNTSGAIYLEKRKEEDIMCPSTHLGQHICLCVYIYTYAYSYTYIYMYMNTCMYIHVYMDVV